MSDQSAERKRIRYYRYGPHVVCIVRDMNDNGENTETLSVTRNGHKAAGLRNGHGYARLPKKWRNAIRKEAENRE